MDHSHEFAFFCPEVDLLSPQTSGKRWTISNNELVHRLYRVIRLKPEERVIFFGHTHVAHATLQEITQTQIVVQIKKIALLSSRGLQIDLLLPLLEKAAFQEACIAAAIFGVRTIVPIVTQKTKRTDLPSSEKARIERSIYAACEQSKQFILPRISPITKFSAALAQYKNLVAFDLEGKPACERFSALARTKSCTIIIGPEGDFTDQERALLHTSGAESCRLVPSVLRSENAVMVGLGLIRAFSFTE